MPRITPLRIFLVVLVSWLPVIAVFALLPNPPYTGIERDAHIQQVFHAGQELTTVHEYDDTILPANDLGYPYGRRGWSSHLAITWRLEPCRKTNSIFLRIGGKGFNLTDAVMQHTTSLPYLSAADAYRTKAADATRDSLWFNPADEMLLNHQNQPLYENISLRYIVPTPGQVQIWKDHENWETDFHQMSDLDEEDYQLGLLATFSNIPDGSSEETAGPRRSAICGIAISDINGMLTSKTYHIRKFLLTISAPLIFLVTAVVSYGIYPLSMLFGLLYALAQFLSCYIMLVGFVWICQGRPNFRKWSKKSWLTFWIFRSVIMKSTTKPKPKVWGATGPVEDQEDMDEEDEDVQVIEVIERVPLRNPADFFRSRAPLDDLFFTFESTRWMVEPLKFRNSAQDPDEETAIRVGPVAAPAPSPAAADSLSTDEKDESKTEGRIML